MVMFFLGSGTTKGEYVLLVISTQRLNMELDLQSLFRLLCTVLIGWDPTTPPPPPPHLGSYTRALLVSIDRGHLFVTPCSIFKLLRNPGIDSANLCGLAGRYDNHISTRLLALIDCSIIPQNCFCAPFPRQHWLVTTSKESDSFPHPTFRHYPSPLPLPFSELRAGIFKHFMRAMNWGGIVLSYRPARLHRLADWVLGIDSGAP